MISVIVPVFNTEKYLDQCVASIIRQTYLDWECILVDDGSKDASGAICDKWAAVDSRIRVVHQVNQGVSCARNNGLNMARGEWVMFIDSDDYVDVDYLEHFARAECADIVVGGLKMLESDVVAETIPEYSKTYALDNNSVCYFAELNALNLLCGPMVKMYKMKIIRSENVMFPKDCHYGEDLLFNFKYLGYLESVTQLAYAGYYYRYVDGSLSNRKRDNMFRQDYEQWQVMRQFYVQRNLWNEISKLMLYKRLWGIVYDGLFSTKTPARDILSIKDIDDMARYPQTFACAEWIKWGIVHKMYMLFNIYRFFSQGKR